MIQRCARRSILNGKHFLQCPQDWSIGVLNFHPRQCRRLLPTRCGRSTVAWGCTPGPACNDSELTSRVNKTGGARRWWSRRDAKVRASHPCGRSAVHTRCPSTVIREGDVALSTWRRADKSARRPSRVEEAFGHELVRPVRPVACRSRRFLRPPLPSIAAKWLRFVPRAGGDPHPHDARAHDEGSVGELVAVESLAESQYVLRPA